MRTPLGCQRRWRSLLQPCTWGTRLEWREADRLLMGRRSREPEVSTRSASLCQGVSPLERPLLDCAQSWGSGLGAVATPWIDGRR
eukprot:8689080-Pyramimonas_sp.AAC.1